MVNVLYTFDRQFMWKTFAAIDAHLTDDSAVLWLGADDPGDVFDGGRPVAAPTSIDSAAALDAVVDDVDPDVVVKNHRFESTVLDDDPTYHDRYPVVHVRHGASLGRGETANTTRDLADTLAVALAPGDRWAERYREAFPESVRVATVGIPEADALVGTDPPRERRVLYAPTNHNYGGGSYLETAEDVVETFADTDLQLRFRPHPMDRIEEPGRSVTERCRGRIAELANVTFDDASTPRESLLWADLLLSDCSGAITEWLHTGRPLVQLTATAADHELPVVGVQTDDLSLSTVERVYEDGYPPEVARVVAETVAGLGIPMDGRASERAAREVTACTQ
ncbi:hypothetical protein [Halorientalis pallida]|uniref:CDP-Glycerol:Poly(Glycerophosphate) glycerophosphotransferase n=1 Tax=Halorientalis pallida TaxID=2479928 RepID=A0A498L7I6_9EURY|nr:hypothetical protein [Halorientalis pallida]RXK51705.1 hypothetical protein EAF64_03480 [Halorientalis pallida]